MTHTKIRLAQPGEAGIILALIKELADFEGKLDHVKATEAMIHDAVFVSQNGCEVIFAEWKGQIAGFALFYPTFSTFLGEANIHMEDLYVRTEYRGKGLGRELMTWLAKLTHERNYGRLQWTVLDWNPARQFYEHLGAKEIGDTSIYKLAGPALEALATTSRFQLN